jgi:2-polyprenyl-3-methyl-5-hydroxy-6-metoxy-1,4-benzoquinol methylase
MNEKISKFDELALNSIRENIRFFQEMSLARLSTLFTEKDKKGEAAQLLILDVAPQDHEFISSRAPYRTIVETIDIDPSSGATYICDITLNTGIEENRFDVIFCTEVLEHVSNPFLAIKEISRILKPGGWLFASSPFGFRIHGPLPDNWRFTEHGWRELLNDFSQVEITALEDKNRFLMPLHYTVAAKK